MLTLNEFKQGDRLIIECVTCGNALNKRLLELGLFNGGEIEIVKNDNFGPLIVKIFESKIAIGRSESEKIYVKKI